ncbi:MAG: GGDEF domain-containing protein [Methylococcaceae bacterium]
MKPFETMHKQAFVKLHSKKNKWLFEKISTFIAPHTDEIATFFYRELLNNEKAVRFLNNDLVKNHLRATLSKWLFDMLTYQETVDDLHKMYLYQREIGKIHARIDLPMSLVDHAMGLVKLQVALVLKESDLSRDELADAIILSGQIFDLALAIIDESYEHDLMINEKNAESLKMHVSSQNLAFDYSKLCTSLSEWMRNLLLLIAQNKYDSSMQGTIRHSNFGLWVSHKAHLFLAGKKELTSLVLQLDNIDEDMRLLGIYLLDGNTDAVEETLSHLNEHISTTIWILNCLANDTIEEENGRDPLTHLFNRRYLETVMRHETRYSLENGILFGCVMIDIDFFKNVNDTYGHDNGDRILLQLAEILAQQVRAGDFVFRLGGEEFLIILADVQIPAINAVAEKIRLAVEKFEFKLSNNVPLNVTISIGTAIHDGHPDFKYTIKLADAALYEAKESGRNKVVAAKQTPVTYAIKNV